MISIHIGTHKTGSTSIQSFMAAHEPALAQHGVLYPDIGRNRGGGHFGLKTELRGDADLPSWTALGALAAASPDQHVVVSCEGFEYLNATQIETIAKALRGQAVQVIGYLREYGGMVQSQYAQLSRICRNLDDFDVFFDRYLAESERTFVRFERWAEVFGWPNLRIRLFDRQVLAEGDVVEDFLRLLGLGRAALGVDLTRERNLAPPWQAIEMTRTVFREIGRSGFQDEEALHSLRRQVRMACEAAMEASKAPPQKAVYLSLAQRERCDALTRSDIDALNRHVLAPGLPMPGPAPVAERPFLPSVDQVASADVAFAMARITLALVESVDQAGTQRRLNKKAGKKGNNKSKKLARALAGASGS
jgi:hypothetical protein